MEFSKKKEFQPRNLMQDKSAMDEIIDALDKPMRLVTKDKFTKLENVGLFFMAAGVLGSLLIYGLSKIGKSKLSSELK